MQVNNTPRLHRFGPFELESRAGELRKHGVRIRLQEQPLQILTMLLSRPGEAVLREEIQQKLWPNDTVVEFDQGINAAINRLRTALGDSAEAPRYIETLARRGYRFIGAVETNGREADELQQPERLDLSDTGDLAGKTINHFRVLAKLGSGGMGIVYRAEDTKLRRDVALKFLHCAGSATDEEAAERFRREARAAAALNHPHICTVYGVEEIAGQPMIVMELVEGETLAARLAKGPLPFDQVLKLGIQLAHALDAGHRSGIVHRDFKPANIMLTKSGAKILDFGLARMLPSRCGNAEEAVTVSKSLTQIGAIAGTPQYMAPEQIAGKDIDTRCDIFAFGAVLYEMATGKKAFEGGSQASVFAAVLERQPTAISSLEPSIPVAFERIVNTCLAKDPLLRRQSLHDVALDLEWLSEAGASPNAKPKSNRFQYWAIAAIVAAILAGLWSAAAWRRSPPETAQSGAVHFLLYPPERTAFESLSVSPDGAKIAASVLDASGSKRLWVHSLTSSTAQFLPDTDGANLPFWSPDSKFIGFFAREKLKTVSVTGGPPQSISDALLPAGGTWSAVGGILFSAAAPFPPLLHRVPAQGGARTQASFLAEGETDHTSPRILPDGRRFLYRSGTSRGRPQVLLGSLDSRDHRTLLDDAFTFGFVLPDYLLFTRAGSLQAQRFDFSRARPNGEPIPIAGSANRDPFNVVNFSVSSTGVLVYRAGGNLTNRLQWRSRDGRVLGSAGESGRYSQIYLSPDERLAAVNVLRDGQIKLWLLRLDTNVLSRLTFGDTSDRNGIWSPDSKKLAYQILMPQSNKIMVLTLGEDVPKLLYEDGTLNFPDDWSPDGKSIIGHHQGDPHAVFMLPADGSSKRTVLHETPNNLDQLQFSPDGQSVAYNSVKSGQWEVYISRLPAFNGTLQVSNGGGCQPIWRKDGKELFYLAPDGRLMSVEISEGSPVASPKMLFPSRVPVACNASQYAAASNGQKFLMIEQEREKDPIEAREPLHVLINWTARLQR